MKRIKQPGFFALQEGLLLPSSSQQKWLRLLYVLFESWHSSGLFSMLYKDRPGDPLLHRGTLLCSANSCLAMTEAWTSVLLPQKGEHMCLTKWWGEEMRVHLVLNCVFQKAVWEVCRWRFTEGGSTGSSLALTYALNEKCLINQAFCHPVTCT